MATTHAPWRQQLSVRDQAIVADVGRFRVLSGDQLRRLHFPVEPGGSLAGAVRRSQRVLKRLVGLGVLVALERRVGGVRAGSAGYCYVLGYRGQRLVYPSKRARSEHTLGERFVYHAVDVAEVYVRLMDITREPTGDLVELLSLETEPDCWRDYLLPSGSVQILKPDLFVAIGAGDHEHRWFVEVDRATESLSRVEHKCRLYLAYLRTGQEQATHGVFPKVLWTVPTDKRRRQLEGVFSRLPPPAERLFGVALHNEATNYIGGGDV